MATKPIRQANKDYEAWLHRQLRGDVVADDLAEKRKKMEDGPFPFLRATYWRWAETILTVCPELGKAPPALSVGDIHLENFGTWRDEDGRLIWGVNDFDEAAVMPYVLDLVRLATSATLARPPRAISAKEVCAAILDGYRGGLEHPQPFALDEEHPWLRELVIVPEDARAKFWKKLDKLKDSEKPPRKRYSDALKGAMPEPIKIIVRPRTAGTGSLGRPRWAGFGTWRGGRVVREAKALVPSGWTRAHGHGAGRLRCIEIAYGAYRAPDEWYNVVGNIAVRRLSPNSRKIEVDDMPGELLQPRMLQAMGHELASIHLGTGDRHAALTSDLAARARNWLREATDAATDFVASEHKAWCKG